MTAVLFISEDGTVTGATEPAAIWWGLRGGEALAGRSFLDLFRFEVVVETPEDRAFQWSLLAENSEPLDLEIGREEPEEVFPVTVRLEKIKTAGGMDNGFAAIVAQKEAAAETVPADDSRLRELGGAEHIGFFFIEFPNGACHYSAAWKRLLGYGPRELPDEPDTFLKLVHPDDSEAAPDYPMRGEPDSRTPFSIEFRMRHKSGHYVWVQSVGTRFFSAAGELERVAGFHLDIQERKEIEEECLQNEERFLALIQSGNIGFFDLDFRSDTAFYSPAWLRLLGFRSDDLAPVPETFRRLTDTEMPGEADFSSLFSGPGNGRQTTFTRDLRMRRKDGRFVTLHTHIIRMTARTGELTRVLGFQTGLDGAPPEMWAGAEPELLLAGLQAVNEGVILTGTDSEVLFINEKAAALTGFSAENAIGQDLAGVFPLIYAADDRPAGNLADKVLASGTAILFSREFRLQASGFRFPRRVVVSCLPLRSSRDRILGCVVVFRDPEEMSLTPEELVKSNRMESLGMLASGVAHDFNNLLTTIVGGISLARELRDWSLLDGSERAGLSAKNLTQQLLAFARNRQSERKPMRLRSLILDSVRLASSGAAVRPETELPEDLHPVSVDAARITQVFQNLVINAVQELGEDGGRLAISGKNVELETGEMPLLEAGEYVRIDVEDNGRGIPEENLARIFDPFFSTKKSGTGLGLSTVASIVREHGGRLDVESAPGEGTKFSVYLPKSETPVEAEARRVPRLKIGTGRILFMDDDPEIAVLAENMLERLQYQVDIARNGEEALALFRRSLDVQRPYDAVILDLTIVGGMGGEETFEKLRKLDPDVRAIVSSGYSTGDSEEYYLNRGFDGVLAKPYRSSELGKLLRRVLGLE